MASGFLHGSGPLRAVRAPWCGVELYSPLNLFLRAPDASPAFCIAESWFKPFLYVDANDLLLRRANTRTEVQIGVQICVRLNENAG
jgi:hypothetical protein